MALARAESWKFWSCQWGLTLFPITLLLINVLQTEEALLYHTRFCSQMHFMGANQRMSQWPDEEVASIVSWMCESIGVDHT